MTNLYFKKILARLLSNGKSCVIIKFEVDCTNKYKRHYFKARQYGGILAHCDIALDFQLRPESAIRYAHINEFCESYDNAI